MKKSSTLLFLIAAFFTYSSSIANTVVVRGTVTNNGMPVANKSVRVWVDSSNAGTACYPMHTRFTNALGFYSDTLNCNNNITVVKTSTEGCNGILLTNTTQVVLNSLAESSFILLCTIPPPPPTVCNAEFQFIRDSANYKMIRFYAGINTSAPNTDPVVERKWKFGDGDSLNVNGNNQIATHTYASPGTYLACLRIKTQSGCISELCKAVVVAAPAPPPFVCTAVANFTYIPVSALVKFNSSMSFPGFNDTIISRKWVFGDNTAPLTGNSIDPQHQYAQPGMYNVCLTIKTSKGCETIFCAFVTATNVNSNCVPQFAYVRTAPKKIAFNSSMSWVPQGDSITERKWTFGDGTSLTGNILTPTHEYNTLGVYTVCLRIKTALGCINEVCKPVYLQDSIVQPPTGVNEPIRIMSLYPNPVHLNMSTVVWSQNNNVAAELAIYDIYGAKKWSMNKTLLQGNNVTSIFTGFLANGPYFFRVTTSYGVKSRSFYKM